MTQTTETAQQTIPETGESVQASVRFPAGFRWGVATASYQIESAATEDGRGPSIWDTYSRTPGRVAGGHTGDVACDHYHRYRDDVALMSELGVGTYRFSLAWPRVVPDGSGPVNTRGLDFYDRLVDELLVSGISPMATLYHWDLPQPLEDRGGWPERDTAYLFADYAEACFARLGDRVATWTTLNEPSCSALLGYGNGAQAPGRTDPGDALRAAHHLNLGHGLAAQRLRAAGAAEISTTLNLTRISPANPDDPHDVAAARHIDGIQNRLFLDPLLRGSYPADVLAVYERFGAADVIRDGDLEPISTPIDLLGVNYYFPSLVQARIGTAANAMYPGSEGIDFLDQSKPTTAMGWPVDATGLRDLLLRLAADYPGTPLMVTENGSAYQDTVVDDGVGDPERIAYFDGHLRAVHEALAGGADIRGYLAWSLMDNFEWSYGYAKRFGLIHVDFASQRRRFKDSARWFSAVMRRNGLAG